MPVLMCPGIEAWGAGYYFETIRTAKAFGVGELSYAFGDAEITFSGGHELWSSRKGIRKCGRVWRFEKFAS